MAGTEHLILVLLADTNALIDRVLVNVNTLVRIFVLVNDRAALIGLVSRPHEVRNLREALLL